jgi:predicted homoserine dehydrogenase-like protein
VQKAKLLSARVAVDVSAERAGAALRAVGIDARDIALCETTAKARFGWADGNYIAAGDLATVIDLPIDVVVEATGHPEAGAQRHASHRRRSRSASQKRWTLSWDRAFRRSRATMTA